MSASPIYIVVKILFFILKKTHTNVKKISPTISLLRLTSIYSKLGKVADTLEYFAGRTWEYSNENVQKLWEQLTPHDQDLFFFDCGQMDWEYHAEALCLGLRLYLVNDELKTLPAARRKWQK